jgi:hypothetical protein
MVKPWYERKKPVDGTEFWRVVCARGWNPGAVAPHHGKIPSNRIRDRRTNEVLAGWDQKDPASRRFEQSETVYWVVEGE